MRKLALVLFALVIFAGGTRPALAATILVNTTAQKPGAIGDCTLGEAIDAANTDTAVDGCIAGSGADTITLPAGTYTLTQIDNHHPFSGANGLPLVTTNLTISGAGAATTIIERGADAEPFRILFLGMGSLQDLTIRNGSHMQGAGIYGGATLENVVVSANVGDGIYTEGNITLVHSEVKNNTGVGLSIGTAHAHPYSAVNVFDSIITDNGGRGLSVVQANLTIQNSIISNNGSDGIYTSNVALNLAHSTVANNTGTGITVNEGANLSDPRAHVEIANTAVYGNRGRGLEHLGAAGGTLDLTNSTVAQNDGGILFQKSTAILTISNSTIAFNKAKPGGGILHADSKGKVKLLNTLLANNTGKHSPDCSGRLISLGHNIFGSLNGCDVKLLKSDRVTKPLLGYWLDNGTAGNGHYPLSSDSPAIGKGISCPPADQLNNPRNDGCDIGAIEYIPTP